MTRTPRLVLCTLLLMMQVIAPWVHAHTGAETGGFLHLPGLEFLGKDGKDRVAVGSLPEGTDMIVSVQAGVWDSAEATQSLPDNPEPPYLPAPPPVFFPQPMVGQLPDTRGPPPLFRLSRHDIHPRAPPLPSSNP
jgi:hypothetical protein